MQFPQTERDKGASLASCQGPCTCLLTLLLLCTAAVSSTHMTTLSVPRKLCHDSVNMSVVPWQQAAGTAVVERSEARVIASLNRSAGVFRDDSSRTAALPQWTFQMCSFYCALRHTR